MFSPLQWTWAISQEIYDPVDESIGGFHPPASSFPGSTWECCFRGSASGAEGRQSLQICVTRPEPGNEAIAGT
jgi:hypothetical protein